MADARLDRLAQVLVKYSTRVKKGDLVGITAEPLGQPLVEALALAVIRAGGHPVWIMRNEMIEELVLQHGTQDQLDFLSPLELYAVDTLDVRIGVWAETNTKASSRIDPARSARIQSARRPLMKKFMTRAAEGKLRWCGTQYPTHASAQDAEMSLRQYEDFVFGAGLLNEPDPVAAWQAVHERQEKIRAYLQGKQLLHFKVPPRIGLSGAPIDDGTDLRVDVSKGIWINCAGHENFPDGEVFCGPTGVDGHVNYSFPAVYEGREVIGVRLAFKAGRVVEAKADKNEEFLFKMLDQDAGARTLGEIAIGTNYGIKEFTRNTLFDEKIGGTFHAAVGAGYPESGSSNESGLHWDMVCDLRPTPAGGGYDSHPGGTIEADGQVFHRAGEFSKQVIG
jgi:aminopeptidase